MFQLQVVSKKIFNNATTCDIKIKPMTTFFFERLALIFFHRSIVEYDHTNGPVSEFKGS